MSDGKPIQPDWIHLPSGIEPRCLWHSLHDGELQSSISDLLNRTIRLKIEVRHLVDADSDVTFDFLLSEVTSARATINVRWPGEFVRPLGISREEGTTLVNEYWAKWRTDSLGWTEFEAAFPGNTLRISNADLASGVDSSTLQLQGMLDGDTIDNLFCEVFIAFHGLTIKTSAGQELTLDEYDQLGIDYWEALSRR